MLYREAMAMRDAKVKVEIEEMHTFGFEYLAQLVLHKIVNQCSADLPNRRVGCDVVARGAAHLSSVALLRLTSHARWPDLPPTTQVFWVAARSFAARG